MRLHPAIQVGLLFVGVLLLLVTVFNWWGWTVRVVDGVSMCPTFGHGAIVIVDERHSRDIKEGDIVVALVSVLPQTSETPYPIVARVIKRVIKIEEHVVFLQGDAPMSWSGWVPIGNIAGRVVAVLWKGRCR